MELRDSATPEEGLARAARAAQELCEALWGAMHQELGGTHADRQRVAELSERLADVSASIALLAGAASGPPVPSEPPPAASGPSPAPSEPPLVPSGPPPAASGPRLAPSQPPLASTPLEPPEPAPTEASIEIHDVRAEERSAQTSAWIGAIARRLARHREDRLPFAVLLIEVLGIDQLAHAEAAPELARLIALVERALGAELRPADLLTQEARGRYWLVTPETDRLGARTLAERLARTVRASALHREVGLEVAIGIAIGPDDGRDPTALAAHADVGVYAARACGQSIAPADDPAA
jgi:GGDEF domain-containing protein